MQRKFHSHIKNIISDTHEFNFFRDAEKIIDHHYLHHTSLMPGYLPKDSLRWIEYSGKFGNGYIMLRHNPKSTRYVLKDYWIEGDDPEEVLEAWKYQKTLEENSTNGTETKSQDSNLET